MYGIFENETERIQGEPAETFVRRIWTGLKEKQGKSIAE